MDGTPDLEPSQIHAKMAALSKIHDMMHKGLAQEANCFPAL
jgi:hypothetical protein